MRTYLTLGDTVTVNNDALLPGDKASVVGTPPVWKDNSDATYVDLVTQMNGPGQPQFSSSAATSIAGEVIGVGAGAVARLRLQAMSPAMPNPNIVIRRETGTLALSGSISGNTCPTAPDWVDIPLTGDIAAFSLTPSTHTFTVESPNKPDNTGGQIHWFIYEAQLYIDVASWAPPCRIFPNPNYGVGAGRNYPPTKAQQGGFRNVGYY